MFGVDLGMKHITYVENGEKRIVSFRYSVLKGIYDVHFSDGDIHLLDAYPPLIKVIDEMVRVRIPEYFRRFQ